MPCRTQDLAFLIFAPQNFPDGKRNASVEIQLNNTPSNRVVLFNVYYEIIFKFQVSSKFNPT